MASADRKITFRITRKQQRIIELLKYKENKNTTDLCNYIINKMVTQLINDAKYASERGADYNIAFAKKTTLIISQLVTQKRELLSFRLTQKNEDLIYNHFKYFDDNKDIKTPSKKEINRIVSYIIYYYLDGQNLEKLCEYARVSPDEIWYWINQEK